MINVVDEVLSGNPKYRITHADTTTEEVSIDLVTTVTTPRNTYQQSTI